MFPKLIKKYGPEIKLDITSFSLFTELKKYNLTIKKCGERRNYSAIKSKNIFKEINLGNNDFFHLYPEIELLIRKKF